MKEKIHMRVLLDTSILIDHLRQIDKNQTLLFHLHEQKYLFAISIISYAELFSGKSVWERSKAKEELKDLLSNIEILPLDAPIAERAGSIKANYRGDLIDAIIAATAIYHNYELVTLNVKDFVSIENLALFKE